MPETFPAAIIHDVSSYFSSLPARTLGVDDVGAECHLKFKSFDCVPGGGLVGNMHIDALLVVEVKFHFPLQDGRQLLVLPVAIWGKEVEPFGRTHKGDFPSETRDGQVDQVWGLKGGISRVGVLGYPRGGCRGAAR